MEAKGANDRNMVSTTSRASPPIDDADQIAIPYGKSKVARWFCSSLASFLFLLCLPKVEPDWFVRPNWFYVFGLVAVGSLLIYFVYLFFVERPGIVLDSQGIRPIMDFGGPECIYWTELTGAKPVVRTFTGGRGRFSGPPLNYVDLEFCDPERFFNRLGPSQRRGRDPYYRAKGIPYAIFAEYLKLSPEEIAETVARYIAKYGSQHE